MEVAEKRKLSYPLNISQLELLRVSVTQYTRGIKSRMYGYHFLVF